MAEFEEENPFPRTDEYLFLGGPEHGKYREVVAGDAVFKVMVKPEQAPQHDTPVGFGFPQDAYVVTSYVRRELGAREPDGTHWVRSVYVHEDVTTPDTAQQLLIAALTLQFAMSGRKVEQPNGTHRG